MVSELSPQGISMTSSPSTPLSTVTPSLTLLHSSNPIPPSLKFLFTGIRTVISSQLTPENYLLWKSQVTNLFSANGYLGYLDGSIPQPPTHLLTAAGTLQPNPDHALYILVDKNLSSALLSTISNPLLPYLVNPSSCHDLWLTIQHRLQPTNRSRLLQLKCQLYTLSMKDQTMTQYLSQVKTHVDAITAAGSHLDNDDIILYILNGLPATYQSFKTAICTNLQPLKLDDFYALLCSEEANLNLETQRELLTQTHVSPQPALVSQNNQRKYRLPPNRPRTPSNHSPINRPSTTHRKSTTLPTCQICLKIGHTADRCWHRANLQYQPAHPQALLTSPTTPSTTWILDTGATSHLTPAPTNLQQLTPYHGNQHITVGNGNSLPIANSGYGILPTPNRKLLLSPLFHVPNLTHHLISVHQLTKDNACSITFDSYGFTLHDSRTNAPLFRGQSQNGLYILNSAAAGRPTNSSILLATASSTPNWHARLGHPNSKTLKLISRSQPSLRIVVNNSPCVPCH